MVFHTAMSVVRERDGFCSSRVVDTRVRFRSLTDDEIETYLLTERPYDCAGSARSEALGITLLQSIDCDDPTALVGLPLIALCDALRAAGFPLLGEPGRE
jgi:septum formation protein